MSVKNIHFVNSFFQYQYESFQNVNLSHYFVSFCEWPVKQMLSLLSVSGSLSWLHVWSCGGAVVYKSSTFVEPGCFHRCQQCPIRRNQLNVCLCALNLHSVTYSHSMCGLSTVLPSKTKRHKSLPVCPWKHHIRIKLIEIMRCTLNWENPKCKQTIKFCKRW